MKDQLCLMDFKLPVLMLIVLCILLTPVIVQAGTFFHCIDKEGNEALLDFPFEGHACRQVGTYEEISDEQMDNRKVASPGDKITKIVVRGNQVLVPVTLVYGREEVIVNLLLDTGATATTIHNEIADRLFIKLYKAKKAKAQVVGGAIIEASIIKMDSLKLGTKTFPNHDVFVVPHEGSAVKFDGLLGMDVLGNLTYKIDLKKQIIIWD